MARSTHELLDRAVQREFRERMVFHSEAASSGEYLDTPHGRVRV